MKLIFPFAAVFLIFLSVIQTSAQTGSISGTVHYARKATNGTPLPLPMNNIKVKLYQNNLLINQDTTNSLGSYSFSGLTPGVYNIKCSCTKPWGGANKGADTQAILRHIVRLNGFSLTGIYEKAAHVSGNPIIHSVDALRISRRFVGILSSFPVGDWCFEEFTIQLNTNQNTTQNILGVCYGDVNGSYTPPNTP